MINNIIFTLPAPLLARFVELADQAHWDDLIASGFTPVEIVDLVLTHVDEPVSIDDYETFIGAIRTLPPEVWASLAFLSLHR